MAAARGTAIDQIDVVLCDECTAMAHIYFCAGEPDTLLVDLDAPTSEATFDRRGLAAALLGAPSAFMH